MCVLPDIHVLHAHDDVSRVVLEGAVEVDDARVVAVVHDAELAHNALPHLVLRLDVYDLSPISTSADQPSAGSKTHLPCHYDLGSGVLHLAHGPSVA